VNYKQHREKWRGHPIHFDRQQKEWLFSENRQLVKDDPQRECGYCGISNTPEGHDGCLGTLPGVMNACCGHGSDDEAYVQFDTGKILRGSNAVQAFKTLRRGI